MRLRRKPSGIWVLDYEVDGKRRRVSTGTRDSNKAHQRVKQILAHDAAPAAVAEVPFPQPQAMKQIVPGGALPAAAVEVPFIRRRLREAIGKLKIAKPMSVSAGDVEQLSRGCLALMRHLPPRTSIRQLSAFSLAAQAISLGKSVTATELMSMGGRRRDRSATAGVRPGANPRSIHAAN